MDTKGFYTSSVFPAQAGMKSKTVVAEDKVNFESA
jgi:hypothetical protein|tara:strand:+ start:48 stop:152 length:105 start_codon:yes stop_codon:yes gene_type:complete